MIMVFFSVFSKLIITVSQECALYCIIIGGSNSVVYETPRSNTL